MLPNFEHHTHEANKLLYLVGRELGTNHPDQAARIFRAVLHALRDRLPVEEAAHFAAQLPIIWKGIYYDQYDPTQVPVRVRHAQDWLDFIRSKNPRAQEADFPTDEAIADAFTQVMHALRQYMSPPLIDKIEHMLHHEILELMH